MDEIGHVGTGKIRLGKVNEKQGMPGMALKWNIEQPGKDCYSNLDWSGNHRSGIQL